MYYDENGNIIVEKSDNCYTCKRRINKNKPCPLLEALFVNAVHFEEYLEVLNCSDHEPIEHHLKIVKKNKDSLES